MVPTTQHHHPEQQTIRWLIPLALIALIALLVLPRLQRPAPAAAPVLWPTRGWQTAAPEEQGFDSARLAEGIQAMRDRQINIHSLLIVRNGKVLVDAVFYPYDGAATHEVASVTKSIMPALVAIAAEQGKLSLDAPMLSFFPDRAVANRDAWKERITVRHLMRMSSGLECTDTGDEATLREMRVSPDWAQFTLDRTVVTEPGAAFTYCSPAIHLLSPILQQATGMTAQAFAQQYLFGPLGISDVRWLTDPQGYNRGSEGIYFHPQDMAKIGYLWLHQGEWEGAQIVPRAWIDQSVSVQMAQTGRDDTYGYGWWITGEDPHEYAAVGRGGQRIQVYPAQQMIVVTTGGGFEYDEIVPLLEPAVVDLAQPLPANPSGVAQLNAALATVAQAPAPLPVAPLPAAARAISGRTIACDSNPIGITTMRLDFAEGPEAIFDLRLSDGNEMLRMPIGLDGIYRMSAGPHDLPQGNRGFWKDATTFSLEYDNIANNDHILFQVRVAGDQVQFTAQETAHELGATFTCRLKEP